MPSTLKLILSAVVILVVALVLVEGAAFVIYRPVVPETETAYDAESPYRGVVEMGYSQLREAGVELRNAGVAFHDLSDVFAKVNDTLYKDSCCHFNEEGNRILAEAMAQAIVTTFGMSDG